jgi:hypothetical protein
MAHDGRSDAASPSSNNDNVDVDTIHDDMNAGSLGGLAQDQVLQLFSDPSALCLPGLAGDRSRDLLIFRLFFSSLYR